MITIPNKTISDNIKQLETDAEQMLLKAEKKKESMILKAREAASTNYSKEVAQIDLENRKRLEKERKAIDKYALKVRKDQEAELTKLDKKFQKNKKDVVDLIINLLDSQVRSNA